MEEEINYASLVLGKGAPAPREEKEDRAVISEVNPKELATPFSKVGAAAPCHSHLLLVCLGILCVILAVIIMAMVLYITIVMNKQEANLEAENEQLMKVLKNQTEQLTADNRVLKNQTQQLTADNRVLKNQTEQLTADNRVLKNRTDLMMVEIEILENQTKHLNRQKDDFNWTLGVILKFNEFPVNEFCPNKKCQPCRDGWILYQEKCYLFYKEPPRWKTWIESRTYCKDNAADLVVIDNQQEQEFISEQIEFYFDTFHGYWIGLYERDNSWVWIDGRKDSLGYWIKGNFSSGSYALMMPQRNLTESWQTARPEFKNKFICESDKVLMRPNQAPLS
ncbi:uncharacterized protein [Leuresthes tenuis]|uniref:uncharacterized protein n=1 Tax=Leuresthes tenuis TaxID=355514 RepID=UPI003B514AC2